MNTELTILGYTLLLGIVQLLMAAQASTSEYGIAWNLSPRDEKKPELKGVKGRIERSFKNFQETFPFFVAAVVLVTVSNQSSPITSLGAQIYFGARLVYIPLYIAGIPVVRSLVWLSSLIGIGMMLTALF